MYVKTIWSNKETKLNSDNLNKMENELEYLDNQLDNKADKNIVYVKSEIDNKISNINSNLDNKVDSGTIYTKSEIDTKLSKITIPDTTNFVIKDDIYTKLEIDTKIDNINIDTSNLVTKDEITELDNKVNSTNSNIGDVTLLETTNKTTVTAINELNNKVNNMSTIELDNYYNKTEIDTKLSNVTIDTSGLATKDELSNKADKLTTYTKLEIDTKIDNIVIPDISNLATKYELSLLSDDMDWKANVADVYSKTELDNILAVVNNDLGGLASQDEIGDITLLETNNKTNIVSAINEINTITNLPKETPVKTYTISQSYKQGELLYDDVFNAATYDYEPAILYVKTDFEAISDVQFALDSGYLIPLLFCNTLYGTSGYGVSNVELTNILSNYVQFSNLNNYTTKSTIGETNTLNTVDKSSIVNSINELYNELSSGLDNIITALS